MGQPERSSGAGGGHHLLSFTHVFLLQPRLSPTEGQDSPRVESARVLFLCLFDNTYVLGKLFLRWDSPLNRNKATETGDVL